MDQNTRATIVKASAVAGVLGTVLTGDIVYGATSALGQGMMMNSAFVEAVAEIERIEAAEEAERAGSISVPEV
jgi:hypothetical protein